MPGRWTPMVLTMALVVGGLGLLTPGAQGHGGAFSARYIAGSAHVEAAGVHQAVGPVDCGGLVPTEELGGTLGGACFDLSEFADGEHAFSLHVEDEIFAHVSVFAGFDSDGDGCVGCAPGGDLAWEGTDFLGGQVGEPGVLAVWVRAVSEDGAAGPHLASSGSISGFVFDDPDGTHQPCERGEEGTEKSECERFESELPYPYPCVPACEGDEG